ncbi:hypothetical protein BPULL_1962 [Bifidobacterium pullorum]|uniref:Uncharacterized protein n=1 Tax=Bifidobacterium pullorum TaxID=78448 RepID=A0A7V8HRQ2_9BIFI|nr:hypothetical protein BPULL_1962 [Bifidobacterium pullorum]
MNLWQKMPDYIMKLVDEGVLHFRRDANGQIMPFVFDNKEKVFKQVRLDWNQVDPDITPTLRHLETQMAISTVLAEVQSLREEIAGIHIELQNDRLALAESAWDKLMQARTIEDARLREMLVVQAITTATDAKRTLMRNFTENMKYLDAHSGKKFVERVQDKGMVKAAQETVQGIATNPNRGKAADAFHDLVSIINAVRVEGTGYEILEQDEASKECLIEFRKFIIDNKLDERNTLLVINSNLGVDEKMSSEIINQFSNVAKHIAMLDNLQELEASAALALEPYIEKNEHSNSTNVSGKAENENLQKERLNKEEQDTIQQETIAHFDETRSSTAMSMRCKKCNCEIPNNSENQLCENCRNTERQKKILLFLHFFAAAMASFKKCYPFIRKIVTNLVHK